MMRRTALLIVICIVFVTGTAWAGGFGDYGRAELLPVHIVAMSLATLGLGIGGYIARYLKKKNKQWLKLHKRFQWISSVLGLVGISTGFIMVQSPGGSHLRYPHSIIAVVSLCLIVGAISFAYKFLKGKKHKKEFRLVHRWTGRFAILSFLVTIFFGLFAAGVL